MVINNDLLKAAREAHKNKKAALANRDKEISNNKRARKEAEEKLLELEIKRRKLEQEYKEETDMINREAEKLKKTLKNK